MRMPRRGERGFTLIELLIVVAILGVLAAVVIPNVGRFIGRGEEEAAQTELSNIQTAVIAMMTDNNLAALPVPVASSTDNMSLFPDVTSVAGSANKLTDPAGYAYAATDGNGYLLYQHDLTGTGPPANPNNGTDVNYVAMEKTTKFYTVDASGTVKQWDSALLGP